MDAAPAPEEGIIVDTKAGCVSEGCDDKTENWYCLICKAVFCSRYVHGHMVQHNESTSHTLVLSFSDLSIWCYGCEAYVKNDKFYPAQRAAHLDKFGD